MSTRRAGGHYDATMQIYVDGELMPKVNGRRVPVGEARRRTLLSAAGAPA